MQKRRTVMAKYKSLIVTTLLSVAALTGAVTTGVVRNRSMASSFEGDGYIVNVAETEEGLTAEPVYFSAGTKYKKTYPDEAVFKDIRGTKYTVDQDSFVHYQDGSMSAMTSGVVLNLDDVNGGLVNTYSFDAGTVLTSNGTGFTAENNGTSIPFDNFVWKLSDDKYYVYSDDLKVETVNGMMEDTTGGVEVEYLEDGIIRLSTQNTAWQGIAAGAKATAGDGSTLSFDNKVISDAQGDARLTLGELLMDADDNIKVQSAQDWVPPEFEFTAVDGEDGEIGEDGAAGQAGENGENGAAGVSGELGENGVDGEEGASGDDGDDGSDGSSGKNGSAGSNGKLGGDGANGSIPQNQATEQATISLSNFDVDSANASGMITVIDEDGVLEADTGSIKVIDVSTGLPVDVLIDDMDEAENLTFSADETYSFNVKNLNADTQYRLIVSSGYSLSENGNSSGGTKDFINRLFYTDSTGIILNLENATTTGFSFTIDKKEYALVTSATLTITDKEGNTVFGPKEYTLSSGKTSYKIDMKDDNVAGLSENDLADGSYTVTMKLAGANVKKDVTQKWKTLKQKPSLDKPKVSVNNGGYFELSQPIVSDPNHALTKYVYKIYKGTECVKTIESTSTNNVAIYLEQGKIERNETYTAKTTATYYDNEKNVQIETDYSDPFRMDDQGDSLIYFVHADEKDQQNYYNDKLIDAEANKGKIYTHQSMIWGRVMIKPKNLDLEISQDYPLKVTLESSGNYRRTWTITDSHYYKKFTDAIAVEIQANGLKANTNYRIFATGFAKDPTDSNRFTNVYLGDYVASTTSYKDEAATINLVRVGDNINASFTARMEMTTEDGESNVETDVLDQLEFCLYQGTNNKGLFVGSFTLDDTNPLHNKSSISDKYLNVTDATKQYVITNENFHLANNALTADSYYLEVRAAYDYTASFYKNGATEDGKGENLSGFKNELPFVLGGVQLPISNALPSLPQPVNDAIATTTIKAKDLRDNSTYQSIANQLENLDDDTVVGYRIQARLNNDNGYARAIRYFGFKTSELDKFDPANSNASDPVNWDNGDHYDFAYPLKVSEGAGMPALQVLFLQAPNTAPAGASDLDSDDRNYIKNVDMNSTGQPYEMTMDGYQTVFTGSWADGMKRGYHYTFGFKVRMQVENTSILYPDEYKQQIVGGIGMLSSLSVGAPRQSTSVSMYLKDTTGDGTETKPYKTIWQMNVLKDVDHTWDKTFEGEDSDQTTAKYKDGLRLIFKDGVPREAEIKALGNDSYQLTVPVKSTLNRYQFKMYQKYYDEEETDKTTASGQFLASHEYLPPAELNLTDPNGDGNVKISGSFPESSNEVTFTLSGNTTMLSRIVALGIEMYKEDGGTPTKVYAWDKSLNGLNGNSRTVTVDLTDARHGDESLAGTYSFKVKAKYADGRYGLPDSFAPNKVYAAKIIDGSNFMNSYYYSSSTQGEKYEYKVMNNPYLTQGEYKVEENNTETADPKADRRLRLQSQRLSYSSSKDLWHTMNLYYGKTGAEWLETEDQKSGTGYNMAFCELVSSDSWVPVNHMTGPNGNVGPTITVDTLQPSITYMTISPGITAANIELTTGSYALITPPTLGTVLGENNNGEKVIADGTTKYIWLKLYEMNEGDTIYTPVDHKEPVWVRALPIAKEQSYYKLDKTMMPELYIKDGLLHKAANYMLVCYTWSEGQDTPTVMLGQTVNKLANYMFKTIDNITISGGEADIINYETYQKKNVTVRYKLDRVNGYNLRYTLRRYPLGEGKNPAYTQYEEVADHEDVMSKLLGYTYDDQSKTWKKGAITWSLRGDMTEELNLAPGNTIMTPGYDYVLVVDAVDGSGKSVAKEPEYIQINWPELRKPTGNVSFRITNGNTLWADVSLSDTNRVVVSDTADNAEYLIAYREAGTDGKWTYKANYPVNNSSATQIVSTVEGLAKGWEVGIFAAVDQKNEGGKTALTETEFKKLSVTDQQKYLITSSTQKGLESWGGSLGQENISLDGGNLTLSLAKSYGLEKIAKIEYSLMPWSDSEVQESPISGELRREGTKSLFTTYNSGQSGQFDLITIPTGLKKDGKLWGITIQLFTDDNKLIKTYSDAIPY